MNNNFKQIAQIGIVVRDIRKTCASWAELMGIKSPKISEAEGWESTHMLFHNKPSEGRAKLAFIELENIVIELIQPVGGPSTWQEFLEKNGEGIHHIAFQIENLEKTLEKFGKMGLKVEQRGDFTQRNTGRRGCYIYTDSKSRFGAILELLHNYG